MRDVKAEDIKRIYSCFADDESRDIFSNRLLLSLTSDWKFARNIVGKHLDGYTSDKIFVGIEENLRELNLDTQSEYIIYGAGMFGKQAYDFLRQQKIKVKSFCDADCKKQSQLYCGLKVLSPEDLVGIPKVKVLLAVWNQSQNIKKSLLKLHIEETRIIDCFPVEYYVDKNQYFDKDIIKFDKNEVFLDCGCYDFETSEIFINRCSGYKQIICFEPDAKNRICIERKIMNRNLRDITVLPYGVWDRDDILYFAGNGSSAMVTESGDEKINVVALDNVVKEKVTFIKMDIEGSEMKALSGAQSIIRKYRPKLAICVYHKEGDIIEIPEYILDLVPEYKLYLRHYSNYFATETVLYAVI